MSSSHLQKVKNNEKIMIPSPQSGCGHLQEVVVYKRF